MSAEPIEAIPTVVLVRRTIGAPQAEVFRAWTDPEMVLRWFKPRGGSSSGAQMEVRAGGRYRWGMKLLGHVYYAFGEYMEVDPPRRLVFSFGWERALVRLTDSIVTVEFADLGAETEVVITQERVPSAPSRALHRAGWRRCLDNLDRALDVR